MGSLGGPCCLSRVKGQQELSVLPTLWQWWNTFPGSHVSFTFSSRG